MRAQTLAVLALVAVLAVVAGGPVATVADHTSPVATQRSGGGFTLLAGLIAVVVGARYRALAG